MKTIHKVGIAVGVGLLAYGIYYKVTKKVALGTDPLAGRPNLSRTADEADQESVSLNGADGVKAYRRGVGAESGGISAKENKVPRSKQGYWKDGSWYHYAVGKTEANVPRSKQGYWKDGSWYHYGTGIKA